MKNSIDRQIYYWAHMLDEAFAVPKEWEKALSVVQKERANDAKEKRARQDAALATLEQRHNASEEKIIDLATKLCSIPELQNISSGKFKKFIVHSGRVIVVAKLKDTLFPLYCSTGLAGKSSDIAKSGNWFVFWGIGSDGWFNKIGGGDSFTMNNQFGSSKIAKIADKLNDAVGDVCGFFDGDVGKEVIDAEVDKAEAQKIVNVCFSETPLTRDESKKFGCMPRYFMNVYNVFEGIDDQAAVDNLVALARKSGLLLMARRSGKKEFVIF